MTRLSAHRTGDKTRERPINSQFNRETRSTIFASCRFSFYHACPPFRYVLALTVELHGSASREISDLPLDESPLVVTPAKRARIVFHREDRASIWPEN